MPLFNTIYRHIMLVLSFYLTLLAYKRLLNHTLVSDNI